MIWKKPFSLDEINQYFGINMTKHLDIRASEITDNSIKATMPITEKVLQPFGILHGGAAAGLPESVGSMPSCGVGDTEIYSVVGMEANANHLRPGRQGSTLEASCTPSHLGRAAPVRDIKIHDETNKLICISRLT